VYPVHNQFAQSIQTRWPISGQQSVTVRWSSQVVCPINYWS